MFTYGLLALLCSSEIRAQQVPTGALDAERSGGVATSPNQPADFTPQPPRVTCQGNRLSIAADNSTLGSILSAIHTCLGVVIDMPDGAAGEISYVQLGPGPIREVLDTLLSSTQFNYAIQSSSSEPEKVASILLMGRVKAGDDGQNSATPTSAEFTMTPARQTWLASVRALRAGASTDSDRSRVIGAEPTTQGASSDLRSAQAGPDALVADPSTTDATQISKESTTSARVAEADVQQTAIAADAISAAAAPAPASELQNKIGEMQQLFEQRKKMMADLGVTPTQN